MKKFILIIVLLLAGINTYAHPHLFLDYSVSFIFENNTLKGVQVVWIFDEMFSSTMLLDYDPDRNKSLNKHEVKRIEKEAFSNLRNYNYFCELSIDKKSFPVRRVLYFSASMLKKRKLVYSFFIPVNRKLRTRGEVHFSVYDRTYFCSASIQKHGGWSVKGINKNRYIIEVIDNKKKSYYDGSVVPEEIVLKLR